MKVEIYKFGAGVAEGNATQKDLLGGKGANLAEMASLNLPIPAGFTIPCHWSVLWSKGNGIERGHIMDAVMDAVTEGMNFLRESAGYFPLVSVRSGARVSMPGMMDTILNVGINPASFASWEERLGHDVVVNCKDRLNKMFQDVTGTGGAYGLAPMEQIQMAIKAVFESWNNPRAVTYRKMHGYADDWGTAVNIQTMVFGNAGNDCATGVLFTRNPSTGEKKITGEFLINAQGEDVVDGSHTPMPLDEMVGTSFEKIHTELCDTALGLEKHYKDMQDIEFTIQHGKLYILQTRNAKRSAKAAFKIAGDMGPSPWAEKLISKKEMMARLSVSQLKAMQESKIVGGDITPAGKGIAAGGSVVVGRVAKSSAQAVAMAPDGPVIMVTDETTPDDIKGMAASVGILTLTGGLTSHAAVVARGMDKSCVVGIGTLPSMEAGDWITIDGGTGEVFIGEAKVEKEGWTDDVYRILSMANSDGRAIITDELLPITTDCYVIDTKNFEDEGGRAAMIERIKGMVGKKPKNAKKVRHVIVDLDTTYSDMDGMDIDVNKLIGIDSKAAEAAVVADKIAAIIESGAAVRAITISNEALLPADLDITVISKEPSLCKIMKGGVFMLNESSMKALFKRKGVYNDFAKLMKEAGREFINMGTPVSVWELAAEKFGG